MNIDLSSMPDETKQIFDILRKGYFIVGDHPERSHRNLLHICESHFEVLEAYFSS